MICVPSFRRLSSFLQPVCLAGPSRTSSAICSAPRKCLRVGPCPRQISLTSPISATTSLERMNCGSRPVGRNPAPRYSTNFKSFSSFSTRLSVALDSMSQADFDAPSWTPAGADETYGRFMRIRAYDCFMHEHDIRAALGRPDRDETDPLNSALDEVATGLGFIVGKKANMPQGSRILFNLTGAVSRSFRVEVASRAAVVESLSAPPTVTVDIPAMAFLRRTGGRELAALGRRPDAGRATAQQPRVHHLSGSVLHRPRFGHSGDNLQLDSPR